VLRADELSRHYRVSRGFLREPATVKALAGVSFTLQAGRTLAVVGESGCGKSTLARQLTLIEPPTGGALFIDGTDAATADAVTRKKLRRRVQMVFQNPMRRSTRARPLPRRWPSRCSSIRPSMPKSAAGACCR